MRLLSVPVARFATSRAGTTDLGDLHVYDPVAMAWTDLSAAASGTPPSPRYGHGFTAAGDKLYVHGGVGHSGGARGSQLTSKNNRKIKFYDTLS